MLFQSSKKIIDFQHFDNDLEFPTVDSRVSDIDTVESAGAFNFIVRRLSAAPEIWIDDHFR